MDLATHQRTLLGLFRSTHEVSAEDDPYIRRVAESKDLAEGRRNIFLWRVWVLERTAPLTFRLLRRRGLLEETVAAFITTRNISPFRETQAPDFLEAVGAHADELTAAVARFELALMKVREGDPNVYVVDWPVAPHSVLHGLARNLPFEGKGADGRYRIRVSRELAGFFEIEPVSTTGR